MAQNISRAIYGDFMEGPKAPDGDAHKQIPLELYEEPKHVHKWYDDDGELGIGHYCECGAFRAVSFKDPWEGKTNQEVYDYLQRTYHHFKW